MLICANKYHTVFRVIPNPISGIMSSSPLPRKDHGSICQGQYAMRLIPVKISMIILQKSVHAVFTQASQKIHCSILTMLTYSSLEREPVWSAKMSKRIFFRLVIRSYVPGLGFPVSNHRFIWKQTRREWGIHVTATATAVESINAENVIG